MLSFVAGVMFEQKGRHGARYMCAVVLFLFFFEPKICLHL